MKKKKVVFMGGGNGGAITLQALKHYADVFDIAAVISTSDSGGSSGRLRKELGTLPPGDILRATLSLSGKYDYKMLRQIFYKVRFENVGKLSGHNIGNMFLITSTKYGGDFVESIRALEQAVEALGHVHPVSLGDIHLCVELSNGDHVKTEAEIDEPRYERKHRIKKAWLEPNETVYSEARQVIEEADCIILGPGSLYTSIIATLLVQGVKEAITRSKAQLLFVPPQFYEITKETGPQSLSEMVREIENYLPRPLDLIIYDSFVPDEQKAKEYLENLGWIAMKKDAENVKNRKCLSYDLIENGSGMSPEKLKNVFKEILIDEKIAYADKKGAAR